MNFSKEKNTDIKAMFLFLICSLLTGLSVPFFGIYSMSLLVAFISVFAVIRFQLNSNSALLLLFLLFYVNVFKPFEGFQFLALGVDIFILVVILKHALIFRANKRISVLLVIATTFIIISFLQMFNPNIPSLIAGMQGARKTAFALFFLYLGIFAFKNTEEVKSFLINFSILSLPILLYGIKQAFFLSDFDSLYLYANNADIYTGQLFGKVRATSFFSGPFHFGMFSSIVTIVYLYLSDLTLKKKEKLLYYTLATIGLIACYSSLTRTNLVALVAAFLVYRFIQIKIKNTLIFLPLIVGGIFTVYFYIVTNISKLLTSENNFLRLIGTIANIDNDTRFNGRVDGWSTIIELAKQNPLLAYGTGSAGDTLNETYSFPYHVTSHNVFLKILMETGIIGLLFFVILFLVTSFIILKKILNVEKLHSRKIAACCFSILIIFYINGLVGSTLDTYPVAALVFLFMGIGINNLNDGKETERNLDIGISDNDKKIG